MVASFLLLHPDPGGALVIVEDLLQVGGLFAAGPVDPVEALRVAPGYS